MAASPSLLKTERKIAMSIKFKAVLLFLLPLLCASVFAVGWPQPAHTDPLAQERPPTLHKLEFTGPEAEWPPRPKGQTNVKEVFSQEIPGSLTDALEERLRGAAQRNTNVRRLLGSRFAYLGIDEIQPDKARPRGPSEPLVTLVSFYSYSNRTVVEVQMRGEAVEAPISRKDYRPAESPDEVGEAIALAQQDTRLRDKVTGLKDVNGILVEVPKGKVGYGNRVIEVFFGKEGQDLPDYHALVDLNTRTVLVAEAILPRR
jgi:hypothetical protein